MRNLFLSLFSIVLIFAACKPPVIGDGAYTKVSKTPLAFNAILCDLAGDIEIIVNPNARFNCTIEAQQNIAPLVTTEVVDSELVITLKQGVMVKSYDSLHIKIYTPSLQSVKILGASTCNILDSNLNNHNMMCAIMGAGNINLKNGTYYTLRLQMSGTGVLIATNCKAQNADYALKGTGKIEAISTQVQSLKAIISGIGNISAWATDTLFAETKDAGKIEYKGSPTYVKTKPGKVGLISNLQ